jgi:thiol-disulfide isomerase/thioredoxin
MRFSVVLFGPALLAVLAPCRALLGGDSACAASQAVRAEIAAIERTWNLDTDPAFRRRVEALRALVERAPTDVEAHIAYQDSATRGQRGLEAVREEYRKLHDTAPDSALYAFLYARLFPPNDAELIARDLTGNHPEFPWGHLLAASLEDRKGGRRDEAALRQHLARFQSLCPNSPASYGLVSTLSDPGLVQASARSLRALLEGDENLVQHYRTLWTLEFKSAPFTDYPKIRERVRRDLAHLMPLLAGDTDGIFLLLHGFDLLEDVEGRRRAEETILKARPGSFDAFRIVRQRFDRQNPWPKPGEPNQKRAAYYRTLSDASTEWTSRWRDYPEAWIGRLEVLLELDDVPDEDAIRVGEGLLAALRKRPIDVISCNLYPVQLRVGELWLSHGIRLQEVIRLADSSVTDYDEYLWTFARGTPEDFKEVLEDVRWSWQPLRVEASALLGRLDEARGILAEMEAATPASSEGAADRERLRRLLHAALIERARAGLFVADGRTTEALTTYRKASFLFPAELRDSPACAESVRRARLLFRRDRGNLDGFEAWLAKGETAVPEASASAGFEKRTRKLPEFELRSVDGKLWRLADLKQKRVFVNVWATWCGPCQSELPYIQRLYERLSKRRDVLFLTFNIDDNVGLVAPFLKREKYSFPVLFAKDYFTRLSGDDMSIPRNWIISKDGILELELRGFSSGESVETWTQRVGRLMEDKPVAD